MAERPVARAMVNAVTPYTPGKPAEELKREMGLSRVYKLASNENSLGPSPKALAAARQSLKQIHRYPDGGCFYLKQALAKRHKLPASQLIVGNGSDELIVLALKAFVNPGDEVIIAQPTFLVYTLAATLAEARVVKVGLKDFRYDLEAMRQKITPRTKLIFIANPDNPTGSYVTRQEVERFIDAVPASVLIFFDEAYFEYVQAKDYPRTMRYLSRGNVLVSRSFSKIYGLAGLRVGWAAAHPDIIRSMNQVREPFNVNMIAQYAAAAALGDTAHVAQSRAMVNAGRKFIGAELKKMSREFVPSVTNFILFNAGPRSVAIYEALLRRGIIVREMSGWGMPHFIRVTIGTTAENRLFINALKTVLTTEESRA